MLDEENLKKAFEFYDVVFPPLHNLKDHDGQITYDEIKKVLGGMCDEGILKHTIYEMDSDNDNQVHLIVKVDIIC